MRPIIVVLLAILVVVISGCLGMPLEDAAPSSVEEKIVLMDGDTFPYKGNFNMEDYCRDREEYGPNKGELQYVSCVMGYLRERGLTGGEGEWKDGEFHTGKEGVNGVGKKENNTITVYHSPYTELKPITENLTRVMDWPNPDYPYELENHGWYAPL